MNADESVSKTLRHSVSVYKDTQEKEDGLLHLKQLDTIGGQ